MTYGDQRRRSLLGDLGVFASYPFPAGRVNWEVYGDVTWRTELEGDSDKVEAVVSNLSEGVRFRVPGYSIDEDTLMLRVGLTADLGGLRASLLGTYQDNQRETGYLGLSLAYDF